MPSAAPIRRASRMSSSSLTASAEPPLSRTAARIRKSPSALGTRSPEATVWAFRHISEASVPSSNAFGMGAQPSDCTETIRGRSGPIQPSCSISSNAFHMPMRPVPPPVG